MKSKTILAIETSCDETAASVVCVQKTKHDYKIEVLSNVVASQIEIHKKWGGVYPELASRAHLEKIIPVLEEALAPLVRHPGLDPGSRHSGLRIESAMTTIDAIAVTVGPGLIGSLLMGVETTQILASYFKKPVVPVNHLEGHMYSAFAEYKVKNQKSKVKISSQNLKVNIPYSGIFPILALVVSGGHTSLILMNKHLSYETVGQTIDDAAGEAFDKVARILELGYPGGPAIEKLAQKGNPDAYKLPLSMLNSKDLNFSFSGLKTAVLYLVKPPGKFSTSSNNNILRASKTSREAPKINKADLAASFQKTVTEILTQKTIFAIKKYRPKTVILSGGVSANSYLREHFARGISLIPETCNLKPNFLVPPKNLSTDNALGIGIAGAIKFLNKKFTHWSKIDARANFPIDQTR